MKNKLDNLLRFSQRRSPTPHFWGWAPGKLWPSNSNWLEIFVQCTYPSSFIILCLFFMKLLCWQTHTHKVDIIMLHFGGCTPRRGCDP